MGFTPQQVNEMSVWQFAAAAAGYIRANSTEKKDRLSASEKQGLLAFISEAGAMRVRTAIVYAFDGNTLSETARHSFVDGD
jgi:hypothetical protein